MHIILIPLFSLPSSVNAHAAAVKIFRSLNISGEIAFKNDDFMYVDPQSIVNTKLLDHISNYFHRSGQPWRTNTSDDALAVERHAAFGIGMFSDPVYSTGDWPALMKETLNEEYLPRFTAKESKDLLGIYVCL